MILTGMIIMIIIMGIYTMIMDSRIPAYIENSTDIVYYYVGMGTSATGKKYHILQSTKTGAFKLVSDVSFKDTFRSKHERKD